MDFHTQCGNILLFELSSQMSFDECGLYKVVSYYSASVRGVYAYLAGTSVANQYKLEGRWGCCRHLRKVQINRGSCTRKGHGGHRSGVSIYHIRAQKRDCNLPVDYSRWYRIVVESKPSVK